MELTPDEKRAERFKQWLSAPGVTFQNPEAEKQYKARVTRLSKALQNQEPDRVPCIIPAGLYAAYYNGGNLNKVMYDYEELKRAWRKLNNEFETDASMGPALVPPGRALDITDYQMYKWPGHGLDKSVLSYQCVEAERMRADEYDAFINDPTDFWLRTLFPRIFGKLTGLAQLPALGTFEEIATQAIIPFGLPDVQAALKALMDAGTEAMVWAQAVGEVMAETQAMGIPGMAGGLAKAPFDTLGDTLRGTQGIMMDMFQRPEKLHEAMERITPLTIRNAIGMADGSGVPIVIMPLHKGADTFMSVKQYETFYWPTFRKIIMALVNEGIVPILFAEGSYNKRLEIIGDFPKGTVAWYFDQTDIFHAKEVIGDTCCILGNVPTSLIMTGTPQQVKEHCRKLIEGCGKGGGYVLSGGAMVDAGNPDNLRAMMEAAQEYGAY